MHETETTSVAGNLHAAAGGRQFLAFTLGSEEYGVDIQKVHKLRGGETVTHLANAPAFIKGVINLRGIIALSPAPSGPQRLAAVANGAWEEF